MAEVCAAEHPQQPGMLCTKDKPCYSPHWNDKTTPYTSWPGTPAPGGKGTKKRMAEIVASAQPEEPVGPPPKVGELKVALPAHPTDTQHAAAQAALPHSGTQRRRVYDALEVAGAEGLTDEQIQQHLEMNPSTVRPRRGELVTDGFVVDSGQRRRVASGEYAIVWALAKHEAPVAGFAPRDFG